MLSKRDQEPDEEDFTNRRVRTFDLLQDQPWQQLAWLQEKEGKVTVKEDDTSYFLEFSDSVKPAWIRTHAALFRRNFFDLDKKTERWSRDKAATDKISSLETLMPEGFACRQSGWAPLDEELQAF